ncbi:MAG: MFS transporter [Hamadaea sp.]|nr:MFS transporter [Hamadaea sp.]
METFTSASDGGAGRRGRWWTLGVLALSVLVVGLDGTVLNVALPTLTTALGAGTDDLQWIVDSYIVVFAVTLLPAGMLGDRHGRKRWLIAGLALFGLASAAAAYAGGVGPLVAARAVMGLGAALIMPLSMSVLPVVFDRAERPRAISIWTVAVALGLPLGPVLGGYLLDHYWWGSIFLINIPIVAIAIVAAAVLLPESRDPAARPVDLLGAVLSVLGLGGLVYGVILAPVDGWDSAWPWVAGGLLALAAFGVRQARAAYPMLDLALFRDRGFLWGAIATTVASFAMMGMLFVVPQYLSAAMGNDALGIGVRLLPLIGGMIVGARSGTRVAERLGARVVVPAGLAIGAIGLALGALTAPGDRYGWAALWFTVLGAGLGLAMPTAMDTVLAGLPEDRTGVGSGAVQSMRQVGGALGVAILGSLLSTVYADRLDTSALPPDVATPAEESVLVAVQIPGLGGPAGEAVGAFVAGMSRVLGVSAALVLAGAVLCGVFLPSARRDRVIPDNPGPVPAGSAAGAESDHAGLDPSPARPA